MANRSVAGSRRLVGAVTAVAIGLSAVLVAHSIVAYRQLQRIESNHQLGRHTTGAIGAAAKLTAAVLNAEAAQRGYLLTADPSFLPTYNTAIGTANDSLAELLSLAVVDAAQQQRLEMLRTDLGAELDELGTGIRVAQAEGLDQARNLVTAQDTTRRSHDLQSTLTEIEAAEIARRDVLRGQADDGIQFALTSLLLSTAVGCSIVVFSFYIVQREVSGRRRLSESLQAADRNKDEFLAMLGHELRNPLAAVRSALDVLRLRDSLPGSVAEMHDIIRRQSDLINRLAEDLLDTSRVAHGKIELRKSLVNVVELAERATADTRRAVENAGVAIAIDRPDQPLWADADPTRLAQVISNLLHNAVKFSRPGDRVQVRVSATPALDAVRIRVSDAGIGMDRHTLACVFAPFAQGKSNGERSRGGLGLGLPLAKALVELHGGTLTAHSDGPGHGAEFVVALPLENPPSVPAAKRAKLESLGS